MDTKEKTYPFGPDAIANTVLVAMGKARTGWQAHHPKDYYANLILASQALTRTFDGCCTDIWKAWKMGTLNEESASRFLMAAACHAHCHPMDLDAQSVPAEFIDFAQRPETLAVIGGLTDYMLEWSRRGPQTSDQLKALMDEVLSMYGSAR